MERLFELLKYFTTFHIDYETKVWPLLSSIEKRSRYLNYIGLATYQNVSVEATHRYFFNLNFISLILIFFLIKFEFQVLPIMFDKIYIHCNREIKIYTICVKIKECGGHEKVWCIIIFSVYWLERWFLCFGKYLSVFLNAWSHNYLLCFASRARRHHNFHSYRQ